MVPIPGYVGLVQYQAYGGSFTSPIVIPAMKINWLASCNVNEITTAAGGPYPNTFPGFNNKGVFEFWGPWRDDWNPFVNPPASPILQIGTTVQAKFSIWKDNLACYTNAAFVQTFEWAGQVDKQPLWHCVFVANWQYQGTTAIDSTLIRNVGGDNI